MGLPRALTPPPPLLPLLLLLLLLLRPPAARGNCTFPPVVPNAQPILGDRDSFPENITVTYKCNEGFVKVPGKSDSVICLDSKWSQVAEFCNRSCDVPTRLLFATLKKSFSQQNYFPEGSVVEYECRPGYRRDYSLSEKLTCLKNFKWSKPDEFCKKKSCPNPGDLRHGHVTIPNDILFGSSISFSCNVGYRLVGAISSYCVLADNSVEWSDPLPECQEIFCPDPPEISNGLIYDPQKTYVYQQSVKYKCTIGFTLIGENSIYCTVKDDQGEWSGPPPECRGSQTSTVTPGFQKSTTANVPGTKATSAPQKTTTAHVPGTRVPSAPQKPTTINVPATKSPSTPQKTTTAHVPATEVPSAPQKPNTISSSATEVLSTPQKPNTVNISATKAPSTQKPNTISSSATEALPTPQKPNTVNISATKAPSAQKPNTISSSATEVLSTPQKPNTVNVSSTKAPSTQKPNTVSSSATEALPTPQKPNTVNVSATKVPSTPQKRTTGNDSATTKKSSTSNALFTKTPSAAQNPIMANASATQAIPATHKSTTTKASFTQRLPATQKSTAVHAPTTKGLHTTKRLTFAHITAKQSSAVPRATSTPKGRGTPGSGASTITTGLVAGTVIVILIIIKIFWHYGKSGSYYPHENSKAFSAVFQNLTVTGDASEVRPSAKL
ncbi:complement decay-accelerating factor isoform X2 [Canis lupus familiaris]|uniref:complement decay-accelerating factor isoform X2 n=1 Tax=Canis lupus familiaris TaxID=9615 RepID=UPI0003ADEAFF|nr:complement decay-accelerating factor isoform X2 [Canis lupus familiaris]|eukprot:XP_005622369.1 complement decay-accelerating factor isoform X2 [Canis lupus familiaris]